MLDRRPVGYEEKIQLLESQIAELDDELKSVDAALDQSLDCSAAINKINPKYFDPEGYKTYIELEKEVQNKWLEHFRLNSKIIRKISVRTSDFLDKKISELEKCFRDHVKIADEFIALSKQNLPQEEFDPLFNRLRDENVMLIKKGPKLVEELNEMVGLCRDCIKDTVDKIKD